MTQQGGIIQSVTFDANQWSIIDSANWLLHHGYKVKKIDHYPKKSSDFLDKVALKKTSFFPKDQPHFFIRYRPFKTKF